MLGLIIALQHPVCFTIRECPLEGRFLSICIDFFLGCDPQTPKPSRVLSVLLPPLLVVARNGLQKPFCGAAVR